MSKKNREFIKLVAERNGISTKGQSKTIDRLRYRSNEDLSKIADYMEKGYDFNMIGEMFSRDFTKNTRVSGGKAGEFKSEAQQRIFENKHKRRILKEHEKEKNIPKLTTEEKNAVISKDLVEFRRDVQRNRVYNPDIRKQKWIEKTQKGNWYKDHKLKQLVMEANAKMGMKNLWSENGLAVVHYMETTGASMTKAMQDVIYSRLNALPDHYEAPTEIPRGIKVDDETLETINFERDKDGLAPL